MGNALMKTELRPSSFKGLLRWWFRAGGGSFEDEKRLFGWTGNDSISSLFIVRIKEEDTRKGVFNKIFEKGRPISGSGINYLGFALDQRFKEKDNKPRRQYITGRFSMEIVFRPFASAEDIGKFFATLWLATNLGNFGSRARRCFGSVRVLRIEPEPPLDIDFNPHLSGLESWLNDSIQQIKDILDSKSRKDLPFIGNMEIYRVRQENWFGYRRWVRNVQEGRYGKHIVREWHRGKYSRGFPFQSPLDMCDFMGFLMQAYRSYYEPDHTNMYDVLVEENYEDITVERVGFGLPLPFFFSSKKRKGTINLKLGDTTTRRASPLILKVLSDGRRFEGLFIHLKSQFSPGNASIEVNGVKVSHRGEIIGDFLESLKDHSLVERVL